MELSFEWDEVKAAINLKEHGVSFELAARAFYDIYRTDRYDIRESYGEDRYVTVGLVGDVELAVAYTLRGDTIRIISARMAEPNEQSTYWKDR